MGIRTAFKRVLGFSNGTAVRDAGDRESAKIRQAVRENSLASQTIIQSARRDIRQSKRVILVAEEALKLTSPEKQPR